MQGILAIETSTDACSVALLHASGVEERCVHAARQHNQIIFSLLGEVISAGDLNADNLQALAFGHGPGSFTGLRIAASVVQGLSYATGIGAVGVSTLEAQAYRALRDGQVSESERVLSLIDARIGEVYAALFRFEEGWPVLEAGPWSSPPQSIVLPGDSAFHAVGEGAGFVEDFEKSVRARVIAQHAEVIPQASCVAQLAARELERRPAGLAAAAQPVYVRDEISWKKLAEQGPRP